MDYCSIFPNKEIETSIRTFQEYRNISPEVTERMLKDIYTYGRDIIESDIYRDSFNQVHHDVTSVGEHTLHVALLALSYAYEFQKRGFYVSVRNAVLASLCHDLGIIGRDEKFGNFLVCCYLHPIHSKLIAKKLVRNLPISVAHAISRHMFPLTPVPPMTLTGYILIKADKSASFTELHHAEVCYSVS